MDTVITAHTHDTVMKDSSRICIGIAAGIAMMALATALLMLDCIQILLFVILMVVSTVVMLVPLASLKGDWVKLMDDRISIQAPMAKFDIPYSSIRSVDCVTGFKPGLRTFGYGGIRKGAGDFTNDTLGAYRFAGDTSIDHMIVVCFTEKGKERYAAFNLVDDRTTLDAYNRIREATSAGLLDLRLDPAKREMNARSHRKMRNALVVVVVVMVALAVAIVALALNMGHVDVSMDEDSLTVDASMMHEDIAYVDITDVELRESMDYGDRVGGLANPHYYSGNFRNDEFGKYRLAVHADVPSVIVVHTTGKTVVFNLSSDSETQAFYQTLSEKVGSHVADTTNSSYTASIDCHPWNPTCRSTS